MKGLMPGALEGMDHGDHAESMLLPSKSGFVQLTNQGGGGRRRGRRRIDKSGNISEGDEQKSVEIEGTISSVLAGTMFKVALPSGHEVLAHISGKMRKRFIRLVVGDRVKMEMSPYDTTKARIVFRLG